MEKVEVNTETCMNCVYHGYHSIFSCLCLYILIEKHSRIYEDGKRVVEEGYCSKFISKDNVEELKKVQEIKKKNNV